MKVHITLYGSLRRRLPPCALGISADVSVPEGATIADLMDSLGIPHQSGLMIACNRLRCPIDTPLATGDEVVLAPMVGGGN
jgi:molybdopterin synthase sulfur carrier subunit